MTKPLPKDRAIARIGRPPIYDPTSDGVSKMIQDIRGYFEDCKNTSIDDKGTRKTPTFTGLAAYLGMNRLTLREYGHKPLFSAPIKAALARVESEYEGLLMQNRNNAGVIFSLKNNFKWMDVQTIDISATVQALPMADVDARLTAVERELMELTGQVSNTNLLDE